MKTEAKFIARRTFIQVILRYEVKNYDNESHYIGAAIEGWRYILRFIYLYVKFSIYNISGPSSRTAVARSSL